jgi:hypothetical protein
MSRAGPLFSAGQAVMMFFEVASRRMPVPNFSSTRDAGLFLRHAIGQGGFKCVINDSFARLISVVCVSLNGDFQPNILA